MSEPTKITLDAPAVVPTLGLDQAPGEPLATVSAPGTLFNRNYLLLWQGLTVSLAGTLAFTFATKAWVTETLQSGTLLGVIEAIPAVPAILLGPIGAAWADRFSRRSILMVSDALNGLFALAVAAVLLSGLAGDASVVIAALAIASMVGGATQAFVGPAATAAVPDIVPAPHLTSANSILQLTREIAAAGGQFALGALYITFGAPWLFLVSAVTSFMSAGAEFFLVLPPMTRVAPQGWGARMAAFKSDIAEGWRHIWEQRGLRNLVFGNALQNLFAVPIIVLLPMFVQNVLHLGFDWLGYLLGGYSVASMLGYVVAGGLPLSPRVRGMLTLAAMLVEASCYVMLAFISNVWQAGGLAAAAGVANAIVLVNVTSVTQQTTPSELRGRVFGLLGTIAGALFPAGALLGGFVFDQAFAGNLSLFYGVCGGAAAVVAILLVANGPTRRLLMGTGV